jgi:hypothetical protein
LTSHSSAQRRTQEWRRVHCSASLQQAKEQVGAHADARVPDDPHFLARRDHGLSQGRGGHGEMTTNRNETIVLDQHLQSTRAAMIDTQQFARYDRTNRCPFGGRQIDSIVESARLGKVGQDARAKW